jgi:hypothetical protein
MNSVAAIPLLVTTLVAQHPPDSRPPSEPQPKPCPTEMVAALYTMGGLASADDMHSWLLRRRLTWEAFVREWLVPDLEWGARTVVLHQPFGRDTLADPLMSFDAYVHAQERGLTNLWSGFAEALRPIVRGEYTGGEPVRLICYLGSLHYDPDFVQLLEDPRTRDQWLRRAWMSTQAVLDAGGEIAFDTAGEWQPDAPGYGFVTIVKNMGAGGWIEGTEHERRPADVPWRWRDPETNEWVYWEPEFDGHWRGFDVVANHGHFWRNIMNRTHQSGRFDDVAHYGEVLLMITAHATPQESTSQQYPEWAPAMVRRNVEAGYLSGLMVFQMRTAGVTIEEVLGCAALTEPH